MRDPDIYIESDEWLTQNKAPNSKSPLILLILGFVFRDNNGKKHLHKLHNSCRQIYISNNQNLEHGGIDCCKKVIMNGKEKKGNS